MVALRSERVLALPAQTVPNTLYYVKAAAASFVSLYVTGDDGVAYPVGSDGGSVTPEPDPAPSFTTPPSILSDGNPTVGETLTASDGVVANGSVSGRQWLLAGAAIAGATGATYTPSAAGSYALRVTATGPGGSIDATSTAVTVAGAPVVDPGGPPSGFTYLAGADASRLTGADGAYLMGVA